MIILQIIDSNKETNNKRIAYTQLVSSESPSASWPCKQNMIFHGNLVKTLTSCKSQDRTTNECTTNREGYMSIDSNDC